MKWLPSASRAWSRMFAMLSGSCWQPVVHIGDRAYAGAKYWSQQCDLQRDPGSIAQVVAIPQPQRLVRIFLTSASIPKFPMNPFDFRDFRARNHSFESMAAFTRRDMQLSGVGETERLYGFGITAQYFHVLGLKPELGREFDQQAEIAGNGLQVIVSDRLWRTRFAAAADIVGRKITLDSQPFTVIGVMPAGVEHPGNDITLCPMAKASMSGRPLPLAKIRRNADRITSRGSRGSRMV